MKLMSNSAKLMNKKFKLYELSKEIIIKLDHNSNLKVLKVHGNPIQEYGEFKIIIHSIVPSLKKIDSALVTKR